MDYLIYDALEAPEAVPEANRHFVETNHRKFHEKIYNPKGYLTADTRVILQCAECGIVIDNNWREGMEK